MIDEKKCLQFNQRLMFALRSDFSIITNDFSIYLAMVHFTLNPRPSDTGWHVHKYFELGIPLDYQMIYQVDNVNNPLSVNDPFYVLIPPQFRHFRKTCMPNSSCLGLVIDIQSDSNAIMRKLIYALRQQNFKLAVSPESNRLLKQINIELNSDHRAFTGTMLFLLLHEFVLELFRRNLSVFFCDEPVYRNENELLDIIEHYIGNNLLSQNFLGELTKLCGVTSRHLNRIFHRKYGISIKKFVIRERLQAASQMLLNSKDSVKSIAIECGFNNFSYFTRQFSAHYNTSPTKYRRRG